MVIFHSYVKLPEGTIYIYIRYYITHGYRSHSNSMACVCEPKWHCRCVFSIPLKDVSLFGDHLAIGGWNGSTCQSLRTLHIHGGKMKPNWNLLEHQSKYVKTPKDRTKLVGFIGAQEQIPILHPAAGLHPQALQHGGPSFAKNLWDHQPRLQPWCVWNSFLWNSRGVASC